MEMLVVVSDGEKANVAGRSRLCANFLVLLYNCQSHVSYSACLLMFYIVMFRPFIRCDDVPRRPVVLYRLGGYLWWPRGAFTSRYY